MKTNFFISSRLGAVYRGFSALTSVASCSSYFMKTRPGPKTRAQGLGPGPGPEPTDRRKLLKILHIKKTRSAILCKKTCLTAPHHFSQTYLFSNLLVKKTLVLKSVFPLFHVPAENGSSAFRIRDLSVWPS